MDSSMDGDASEAPALKLPVISFLSVNMCFLSGAWWREEEEGRGEKNRHADSSDKQLHGSLFRKTGWDELGSSSRADDCTRQ